MNKTWWFIVLSVFLFTNLSSAEILMNQPKNLYNVGDVFNISITLKPEITVSDFFSAKIVCSNGEVEIFRSPYFINAKSQKDFIIEAKLDRFLINELRTQCYLKTSYSLESVESQRFTISDKIDIEAVIDRSIVNPGDKIIINGEAIKENKERLEGYIELQIKEINLSITSIVNKGKFNISLDIPKNAPFGNYDLIINSYEKDSSSDIINQGKMNFIIKVNQIIEKIDVTINGQEFVPGSEINYAVYLYDQTGNNAKKEVSLKVINPKNEVVFKKNSISGEYSNFSIKKNHEPGYWYIESNYNDLTKKRMFNVATLEEVSIIISNKTLIIENIGNIKYNKIIEIVIGNEKKDINVNLDLGQKEEYFLSAPEGEYDILVNDGINEKSFYNVALTGRAISVKTLEDIQGSKLKIWFWIFVILILLSGVLYFYRKNKRKIFVGTTPKFKRLINKNNFQVSEEKIIKTIETGKINKDFKNTNAHVISKLSEPQNKTFVGLTSRGGREEACVIILKIKNKLALEQSQSNALAYVDRTLETANIYRSKIYDKGEEKVIIISEASTRSKNNYLIAVNAADKILSMLKEYNQKNAQKIKFGIGINVGEMIVEFKNGSLEYTPIGNTIISARNSANYANSEVFTSSGFHRKLAGKVKFDQISSNLWRMNKINPSTKHTEFIQKFMKK